MNVFQNFPQLPLHDPFQWLGQHPRPGRRGGLQLRLLEIGCDSLFLQDARGGQELELQGNGQGLFELELTTTLDASTVLFRHVVAGKPDWIAHSPWLFAPLLDDMELHLFKEGRLLESWKSMGGRACTHQGVDGLRFVVWAPNARQVSVVGDFNGWNPQAHPMRNRGESGLWELFLPDQQPGLRYKYSLLVADGRRITKADPYSYETCLRPETASIVTSGSAHTWGDESWIDARTTREPLGQPLSIYELHLGSWRRPWNPDAEGTWLNYRELAAQLADYLDGTAFTHVELLPVMEHPFDGSWGYQVTGYFAPSRRFGSTDDFRAFVDLLHQRGYGVILDWVPAHFPKDDFALARFDGSALYEHEDPRMGEHPDWGTLIFNYGRREVRNFLISNALYWISEYHVDGLRVDAVASMLYLDYSRKEGEWLPNAYGGRENLDAIDFLRELNTELFRQFPGVLSIAEESTSWPAVSRPVYTGGLGFNYKWNMGWMHDTLRYMQLDPVHRRFHHDLLTFSMMYAWHENFILVLSHDEVVHGKGSLLSKMPGDSWQKLANLRLYYGWMWCHPGAKLLFMGGELGQYSEWSEGKDIDWRLQNHQAHSGVQRLVGDLNRLLRERPELHVAEHRQEGFQWVVVDDAVNSVYAFIRRDPRTGASVLVVGNFTPVPRNQYVLGVPHAGTWQERLNTDSSLYGGTDHGNGGSAVAWDEHWGEFPARLSLNLPPLGLLVLVPQS